MFSGVIQTVAPVREIYETTYCKVYVIELPIHLTLNLKVGYSIANNGCCLTVISISTNLISFNVIHETLKITNMNSLKIGDMVNIERSLCYNSEIGGHLMTGHIDCLGEIKKIVTFKKNKAIWIKINKQNFQRYIIERGSIGVEGVSLTVNKIFNNHIRICLTPYTAEKTTLGQKKIGNIVNIETDIIIKTITNNTEKILSYMHKYK